MKWFQKKHSVCTECGVHFEPVTGYEARWGQFCGMHRTEHRQNDEKKDAVLAWAEKNWERLHDQMSQEWMKKQKDQIDALAGLTSQQQYMNEAMSRGLYGSGSFNPFARVL